MAFAWMPKATVQAALGPVFLDNCIKWNKEEWIPMGEEILTLAVLSILITAPLGAICILGRKTYFPTLLRVKNNQKTRKINKFYFSAGTSVAGQYTPTSSGSQEP